MPSGTPTFQRDIQVQRKDCSIVALTLAVLVASAALAVRTPSLYWAEPASLAIVMMYANWCTRLTATSASTLPWLVVLLCSSLGMLVLVTVPWNDGNPPF